MDWLSFLPPFFGVLVAFLVQRGWTTLENRNAKIKLLTDIRKELARCSDLLVGQGKLVPTDLWKSAVSSGSLKLIPHDRKFDLASIYFRIECHNYTAEKVWDVMVLATTDKDKEPPQKLRMFSDAEKLHFELSRRLIESEEALKIDIDIILKQNIWS
jgi:hypothetical protein